MKYSCIVMLLSIMVACNKSGNNDKVENNNSSEGNTNNINISIKNYSFNPSTDTVKVGSTVVWTNNDPVIHTVTFTDTDDNIFGDADDNEDFDSGDIPSGKSFNHTFSSIGVFGYHCKIYTYMEGTIVVR